MDGGGRGTRLLSGDQSCGDGGGGGEESVDEGGAAGGGQEATAGAVQAAALVREGCQPGQVVMSCDCCMANL